MQATETTAPKPTICGKCKRVLTDPVSIERGFGPVCWGNVPTRQGATGPKRKNRHPEQLRIDDPADNSDFDYRITAGPDPVMVITDLDRGGMSVTNNMEAILSRIAAEHGAAPEMPIIYRDSEGNYDGVKLSESGAATFYPLTVARRVTNEQEAIQTALQGMGIATPSKVITGLGFPITEEQAAIAKAVEETPDDLPFQPKNHKEVTQL